MLNKTLSAALLVSTCLSGMAGAAETLDITRIELGQAGIARYAMKGAILGNSLSFDIPQEAASDVLASLVVRDPAGGVIDLQTDVPGAARSVLRGTAFSNGVPGDTAAILRALIGQTVSIGTEATTTRGILMGVNKVDAVEGAQRVTRDTALILSDGQMVDVVLDPGARVSFPEEVAETLARALQALSHDDSITRFDLRLAAYGPRDIEMSYVTEAPAWKNAWRLLLDEGRLQGWATLENLSGQDWDDVEVTLTTGAPVAFRRNLIGPRRLARPDAESLGPEPVRAQPTSAGGLLNMYSSGARTTTRAPRAKFPASGSASQGRAAQSHGILRYELPHKIDLAYGRTTHLMYLDLPVEPEIHAFYRPESDDQRVFLSVALNSETALASGLVSVQNAGGFVGDAPFAGALAGQDTMLPFALAPGSNVAQTVTDSTQLSALKRTGDQLWLEFRYSRSTDYKTDVAATVARFTVDHATHFGDLDQTNGELTHSPDAARITVPVQDGKAHVRVTETRTEAGTIPLDARSIGRLLADFQSQQSSLAAGLEPIIHRALNLHAQLERQGAALDKEQARYETLGKEQKRLRDSLDTVRQEALRQRYLDALETTELQIAQVLQRMDAVQADISSLEDDLVAVFKPV